MDNLLELKSIRIQKGKPHKPLLILLCLTKILRGHVNKFTFKEIEKELEDLINIFSPEGSNSGGPQYPFVFLQTSPSIWECSVKKEDLKNPDWPTKKELENAVGNFTDGFLEFFRKNQKECFITLYNYLPEDYHISIQLSLIKI